jgi:hypothetical protein
MNERSSVSGVNLQFLFRVAGPAQRNEVRQGVSAAVSGWDLVMKLWSVSAVAKHAHTSIALNAGSALLFPVAYVGKHLSTTPQDAVSTGLNLGFSGAIAAAATDDPIVGSERGERFTTRHTATGFASSAIPAATPIARRRAVFGVETMAWDIKRIAAGWACFSRTVFCSHVTNYNSREAEYVAIAERRIAACAPLFGDEGEQSA